MNMVKLIFRRIFYNFIQFIIVMLEFCVRIFPRNVKIRDKAASVLDFMGESERALPICIRTTEIRINKLLSGKGHNERKLDVHSRVFISGYYYSGSGAVLDYLSSHKGFSKWSPLGEARMIRFPGGLWDMVGRCSQEGFDTKALVDHYLHITGNKTELRLPFFYSPWRDVNIHNRKLNKLKSVNEYLKVRLEGFLELHSLWIKERVTVGGLKNVLRLQLEAMLDAAATDMGADYLLIDQAINAYRIDMAELVPPSSFIVVHRDPRDQFIDARRAWSQPGRTSYSANAFSLVYRERRERAMEYMKSMEAYGHRFLEVSFEDFIINFDKERKRVDEFTGSEECHMSGNAFSPQRSMLNVGKFNNAITKGEAASLVVGNSQYLNEHSEQKASTNRY